MSKVYTVLEPPVAPDALKNAPLTDGQQNMYAAVLAHFTADAYVIPAIEKGELMEVEKFWLSNECIQRQVLALIMTRTSNVSTGIFEPSSGRMPRQPSTG